VSTVLPKRDLSKVDALLDRLYSMAMRGNVPAAALYLDRILGPVRAQVETVSRLPEESTVGRASHARVPAAREASTPKRLWSVAETAELLGVSKAMIYHLQKTNRLRVCRIGRRVLVPLEDLERLINSRESRR
jgi:excisionase family DNA binding protein